MNVARLIGYMASMTSVSEDIITKFGRVFVTVLTACQLPLSLNQRFSAVTAACLNIYPMHLYPRFVEYSDLVMLGKRGFYAICFGLTLMQMCVD